MKAKTSKEIQEFIWKHFPTVAHLELFLFILENTGSWSVPQLRLELRGNEHQIQQQLHDMKDLIEPFDVDPALYGLRNLDVGSSAKAKLVSKLYKSYRFKIIDLIYKKS